jgi:hypothetical protein
MVFRGRLPRRRTQEASPPLLGIFFGFVESYPFAFGPGGWSSHGVVSLAHAVDGGQQVLPSNLLLLSLCYRSLLSSFYRSLGSTLSRDRV